MGIIRTTDDFRESGVPGLAVPGLAIPGVGLPAVGPRPSPLRKVPVRAYDSDMQLVGESALYESLTVTQNWYTPGTWELKINRYLPGAEYFEPGGYIEVPIDKYIPCARPFFGSIEKFEPALDKDGKKSEVWTLSGRSVLGKKFSDRHCLNRFSSGTGSDTQTSVAYETAIRHILTENAVAAIGLNGTRDAGRDSPGITLEPSDLLRGGTAAELTTRGEKLLDILEQWGKAAGLGMDLLHGTGDAWIFTLFSGTDRSGTGTAAKVSLSVDRRNVTAYDYAYSIVDSANVLVCAGAGDGASRLVAEVYDGTTRPTGKDRREIFLDLSDCTTLDQLTTKGREQLATYLPVQSLTFDYDPESTLFILDEDFFLGDTIVVDFPGVATLTDQIQSVVRTWDSGGYGVKINVGTDKPDMSTIVKKINWSTSAARRH